MVTMATSQYISTWHFFYKYTSHNAYTLDWLDSWLAGWLVDCEKFFIHVDNDGGDDED